MLSGGALPATSEKLLDFVSVLLASYRPSTFFWLLVLSLELCAEKRYWGRKGEETGEVGSVVSERKEGE